MFLFRSIGVLQWTLTNVKPEKCFLPHGKTRIGLQAA